MDEFPDDLPLSRLLNTDIETICPLPQAADTSVTFLEIETILSKKGNRLKTKSVLDTIRNFKIKRTCRFSHNQKSEKLIGAAIYKYEDDYSLIIEDNV